MALLPGLRAYGRREDGVSTVMMALLALPLIAAIGLAVDTAQLYKAHSRLSYAADAAALAGGRAYFSTTRDADVNAYLSANYPQGLYGATVEAPVITENAERTDLTVAVEASVPTLFMRLFGYEKVGINASSTVERQGGLEVALVLDVTGSMSDPPSKLSSMQSGAKALLDTIYDPTMPADSVYAAIVPFRTAVNIGSGHTSWVKSGFDFSAFKSEGWRGCLEQRDPSAMGPDGLTLDISGVPPSSNAYKFTPYLYENTANMGPDGDGYGIVQGGSVKRRFDNNWPTDLSGNRYGSNAAAVGPNLNCPETAVVPLSAVATEKARLKGAIDSFTTVVRGGTQIVLGLTWGWHVLAKDWQSFWGTDVDPSNSRVKVLVLLTDGDNQVVDYGRLPGSPASITDPTYGNTSDYTAYGRLRPTNKSATGIRGSIDNTVPGILGAQDIDGLRNKLTERQIKACDEIKRQGITIVTIGYEVPASAVDGLQRCASKPDFYLAADEDTIRQTFQDLGKTLTSLRIIK